MFTLATCEPSSLEFVSYAPSDTQACMRALVITCPPDNPGITAFKVQTNAPKSYHVKPVYGVVAPGESMRVLVQLKDTTITHRGNKKRQDKFLLRFALIEDLTLDPTTPHSSFWENLHKDQIFKVVLPAHVASPHDESALYLQAPISPTSSQSQSPPPPPCHDDSHFDYPHAVKPQGLLADMTLHKSPMRSTVGSVDGDERYINLVERQQQQQQQQHHQQQQQQPPQQQRSQRNIDLSNPSTIGQVTQLLIKNMSRKPEDRLSENDVAMLLEVRTQASNGLWESLQRRARQQRKLTVEAGKRETSTEDVGEAKQQQQQHDKLSHEAKHSLVSSQYTTTSIHSNLHEDEDDVLKERRLLVSMLRSNAMQDVQSTNEPERAIQSLILAADTARLNMNTRHDSQELQQEYAEVARELGLALINTNDTIGAMPWLCESISILEINQREREAAGLCGLVAELLEGLGRLEEAHEWAEKGHELGLHVSRLGQVEDNQRESTNARVTREIIGQQMMSRREDSHLSAVNNRNIPVDASFRSANSRPSLTAPGGRMKRGNSDLRRPSSAGPNVHPISFASGHRRGLSQQRVPIRTNSLGNDRTRDDRTNIMYLADQQKGLCGNTKRVRSNSSNAGPIRADVLLSAMQSPHPGQHQRGLSAQRRPRGRSETLAPRRPSSAVQRVEKDAHFLQGTRAREHYAKAKEQELMLQVEVEEREQELLHTPRVKMVAPDSGFLYPTTASIRGSVSTPVPPGSTKSRPFFDDNYSGDEQSRTRHGSVESGGNRSDRTRRMKEKKEKEKAAEVVKQREAEASRKHYIRAQNAREERERRKSGVDRYEEEEEEEVEGNVADDERIERVNNMNSLRGEGNEKEKLKRKGKGPRRTTRSTSESLAWAQTWQHRRAGSPPPRAKPNSKHGRRGRRSNQGPEHSDADEPVEKVLKQTRQQREEEEEGCVIYVDVEGDKQTCEVFLPPLSRALCMRVSEIKELICRTVFGNGGVNDDQVLPGSHNSVLMLSGVALSDMWLGSHIGLQPRKTFQLGPIRKGQLNASRSNGTRPDKNWEGEADDIQNTSNSERLSGRQNGRQRSVSPPPPPPPPRPLCLTQNNFSSTFSSSSRASFKRKLCGREFAAAQRRSSENVSAVLDSVDRVRTSLLIWKGQVNLDFDVIGNLVVDRLRAHEASMALAQLSQSRTNRTRQRRSSMSQDQVPVSNNDEHLRTVACMSRVICVVRRFGESCGSEGDVRRGTKSGIDVDTSNGSLLVTKAGPGSPHHRRFAFDSVCEAGANVSLLYSLADLVDQVVDGHGATVVLHGPPGISKSDILFGNKKNILKTNKNDNSNASSLSKSTGLMIGMVSEMFICLKQSTSFSMGQAQVTVTAVSLDNKGRINDLLAPPGDAPVKHDVVKDEKGRVYTSNLVAVELHSEIDFETVQRIVDKRRKKRKHVQTLGDLSNPRKEEEECLSHCVVCVEVVGSVPRKWNTRQKDVEMRVGKLTFVNLASDPRGQIELSTSPEPRENCAIDIDAVQHVLQDLSIESPFPLDKAGTRAAEKAASVLYRGSKLTYMLKDVLTPQCTRAMIVAVGDRPKDVPPALRALQLASRCGSSGNIQPALNPGRKNSNASVPGKLRVRSGSLAPNSKLNSRSRRSSTSSSTSTNVSGTGQLKRSRPRAQSLAPGRVWR